MKKEIAEKWIAELLSGKYQQGTGKLRGGNDDRYCCLGVLCEIAAAEGIAKRSKHPFHDRYYYGDNPDTGDSDTKHNHSTVLPEAVKEWAGMKDDCGKYGEPGSYGYLTSHNDSGMSFKQIAEIIEKNIDKL
jgi:hypothetical protein